MTKTILMIYMVAAILGGLCGLVGAMFQKAIAVIQAFWISSSHHMMLLGIPGEVGCGILSACFMLFSWFLVQYFAPEASGSGVQEVEGVLLKERTMNWRRLLPVKFIGGVFSLGAYLVVGREGPMIQMGGNLGKMLAECLKLHPLRANALIASGAAAGLAAAFNAPLAGIFFVFEELRGKLHLTYTSFKMVVITCVFSVITLQALMGNALEIQITEDYSALKAGVCFYVIWGAMIGLCGIVFNKMLMRWLLFLDRLPKKYLAVYAGVIGFVVGVFAWKHADWVGSGEHIYGYLFPVSQRSVVFLFLILGLRLMLTLGSYGTGVPGGIFAPLLALGTLLGAVSYQVLSFFHFNLVVELGVLQMAGMASLFAASVRAPLTGIILVVEMSRNYSLILPLILACLASSTVAQLSHCLPVYASLLKRVLNKTS